MAVPFYHKKHLAIGLRVICWVLAFVPLVYLCLSIVRYHVDFPHDDQWAIGGLLCKSYQGTLSFGDFWEPHVGSHRLLFPRLVLYLLAQCSGWNTGYDLMAGLIFAAATFAVLIWQVRRTGRAMGVVGIWVLVPVVSLLVFSLAQTQNWLWGWQLQIFMSVFATVAGIVLMANLPLRWPKFAGALLLGVLSTYSFATGLLYWPIGLLVLFLGLHPSKRTRMAHLLIWVLTAFVVILLYLQGTYRLQGTLSLQEGALQQPVAYLRFVATFVGTAVVRDRIRYDMIAGVVGPVVLFLLVGLLLRSGYAKLQNLLPYIAFGLFSIGAGFLTGIGRLPFGLRGAILPRYVTISYLLWFSIAVLLYMLARYSWLKRKDNKMALHLAWISPAALLVLVCLLVRCEWRGDRLMPHFHRQHLQGRAEYFTLVRNEPIVEQIYRREGITPEIEKQLYDPARGRCIYPHPSDALIREEMKYIKDRRLSIYRDLSPQDGRPPLHLAAESGHKDVVELLLSKGTDVNAKTEGGWTPLHDAAMYDRNEVVELLLTRGADVNAGSEAGLTPLHLAVLEGHKEVVEMLLAKGADVNAKAQDGWTPLLIAAWESHREVVELLLAKEADVNVKDDAGYTPLLCATENGHKDIVELLLSQGADVNAKGSKYGRTPLHVAAHQGHKDVVELLLARGADVNAKDKDGKTPLDIAVKKGYKEVAGLLRAHGAR